MSKYELRIVPPIYSRPVKIAITRDGKDYEITAGSSFVYQPGPHYGMLSFIQKCGHICHKREGKCCECLGITDLSHICSLCGYRMEIKR